ncbi:MAG: VCBS repeat-containing protein [Limisphaerales bacterium]
MKKLFLRTLLPVVAAWVLASTSQTVLGQSVSFTTNSYYVTLPWIQTTTANAIAADVFGTGRPAIISYLTVMINFGNGTFATNAFYSAGGIIGSVVAADVNMDGKLDLIAVGSDKCTVLTNFNFGSFGSNATINAGGNCAVTSDLNNDGKPDLLIGGNTNVFIFTNNGSGRFGSNATLNVLGPVFAMAVADVNSDGSVDLIIANKNNASLTVFTNNGGGVLVSNATWAAGGGKSFAAADVNGDGLVDLITPYNLGTPGLRVLTNNGSGTFGSNATLRIPAGNGVFVISEVVAADLNGDGWVDLVGRDGTQSTDIIAVWTNSAYGFAYDGKISAGAGSSDMLLSMSVADLNGDNKPDLVLGNNANFVTVLLNTTLFASPPLNIFSAGNQSVLYWNGPAPDSVLQVTTNLNNPNWITVTNGKPITGVMLPQTSPNQFYRLISQ